MELERLIAEFNAQTGIEKTASADGVWRYSADGRVFGITADEQGERLYLFGDIPPPGEDREDAFRKTVLEANYFFRGTGGATLSPAQKIALDKWNDEHPEMKMTAKEFLQR